MLRSVLATFICFMVLTLSLPAWAYTPVAKVAASNAPLSWVIFIVISFC
jgi:hypothetical protein